MQLFRLWDDLSLRQSARSIAVRNSITGLELHDLKSDGPKQWARPYDAHSKAGIHARVVDSHKPTCRGV